MGHCCQSHAVCIAVACRCVPGFQRKAKEGIHISHLACPARLVQPNLLLPLKRICTCICGAFSSALLLQIWYHYYKPAVTLPDPETLHEYNNTLSPMQPRHKLAFMGHILSEQEGV